MNHRLPRLAFGLAAPLVAVGLLIAALAMSACGGDDDSGDPGQSPDEVAKSFSVASAKGDGETACGLLTEEGKEATATGAGTASCEEAVSLIGEQVSEEGTDALEQVETATYQVIEETEETASVQATAKGETPNAPFKLVKVDGEWRIDQ